MHRYLLLQMDIILCNVDFSIFLIDAKKNPRTR